ncbi:hypothetical protein [Ostreiculturibacter nitratireducens]|uniref:hypothetical protein n=1 Tax=Ostreiculturibacter nitratireducens TaxID=3075226 RepID=UPI0031B5C070
MPKLVKLYIKNVLIGFALAAAFVGLILWLNVAGLWHLVTAVSGGWIAVLMLWVFNAIVFAGVQFAFAVMRLADDDDGPRGGNRARVTKPASPMVAVPVSVSGRDAHRRS